MCGGIMISPAMMNSIVASRDTPTGLRLALPRRAFQREATVRYVRCPDCHKTMNRQAFGRISGVIVDVCREHGVWFDAGELAEVLAFIERGGLETVRRREIQELEEKKRESIAEQGRVVTSVRFQGVMPGGGEMPSLEVYKHFGAEILNAFLELWRDVK